MPSPITTELIRLLMAPQEALSRDLDQLGAPPVDAPVCVTTEIPLTVDTDDLDDFHELRRLSAENARRAHKLAISTDFRIRSLDARVGVLERGGRARRTSVNFTWPVVIFLTAWLAVDVARIALPLFGR